jgi:hypothetical protein
MNRTFSRAGSYPSIQAIALGAVAPSLDMRDSCTTL